jgi:hypothetical protein
VEDLSGCEPHARQWEIDVNVDVTLFIQNKIISLCGWAWSMSVMFICK